MDMQLTVIIHSFNDGKNIKSCLESAKILSENILLVDMYSADNTVNIAKKLGATVCYFPHSKYVEPARNFGIKKTETDWIFILDADERITPELAFEIKSVIRNSQFSHYQILRKNIFAGIKWLKYGGWWPDRQIRLINKKYFKDWPEEIHSAPLIEGQLGSLKNPLLHYFHGDMESMVKKTVIFENIESELLYKAQKPVNVLIFFRKFMGELYRRLIRHLGFLDGEIGIIESIYQAFSKTITYIYLYEKTSHRQASRTIRPLS